MNSEFGALVSHVARNKLFTWAWNQYVSQEMRAGRGVGAAGRKDLKRKYAATEPAEKASHLQSLDIPAVIEDLRGCVDAHTMHEPFIELEEDFGLGDFRKQCRLPMSVWAQLTRWRCARHGLMTRRFMPACRAPYPGRK